MTSHVMTSFKELFIYKQTDEKVTLWINVTFVCNNCIFGKFFFRVKIQMVDEKVCF